MLEFPAMHFFDLVGNFSLPIKLKIFIRTTSRGKSHFVTLAGAAACRQRCVLRLQQISISDSMDCWRLPQKLQEDGRGG